VISVATDDDFVSCEQDESCTLRDLNRGNMNTNKLILISFAFGVAASAGCGSDVTATASGVFPAQGFTGRTLRVEISGDQTKWKDGATVSFGAGVTVNSVSVSSATDLFADITVDAAADAGMRDVTVTSGGSFTLKQAFELVPPVELVVQGDAGQGGLPNFTLVNHDFDNPFDLTTDAMTGMYSNLMLTGPSGVQFFINSATEFSVTGQAFIDLDAAAGTLTLASGAGQKAVTSNCGSFPVTARTGTPLSGGTAQGSIANVGDSNLYTLTAAGTPSLVHISVLSSDPKASVGAAIFTDATWNHAVGLHEILNAPSSVTFVVAGLQGSSGFTYTVSGTGEMLNSAAYGSHTTNGTVAQALPATALPFTASGTSLAAAGNVEVISFTVTQADVTAGKNHAHVVTDAGGDPATDTNVNVTNGTTSFLTAYGPPPVDGTECTGFFGCAPGDQLGEDVLSDALPAGTYYVLIGTGNLYSTTDKNYAAVVWLE
jgi:hypothetical protein